MKNIHHCLKKALIIKGLFILCLMLLIFSCRKNENNGTYVIINQEIVSKLKSFIKDSKLYGRENEIILGIDYDEKNRDTVLAFINTKPFSCEDMKGVTSIDSYNVYLYSNMDDKFVNKNFKILKPLDSCEKYIDKRLVDVNFEVFYYFRNGKLIKM